MNMHIKDIIKQLILDIEYVNKYIIKITVFQKNFGRDIFILNQVEYIVGKI